MSIEESKALIRRIYELSSQKDMVALFELYDPDYIEHTRNGDYNLEQLKKTTSIFFTAFPDSIFTIENIVAEKDKVAYQATIKRDT